MMTQPSSTLNTGLSLQNDVCTWARVTANALDFLFRPVQRPLKMFLPLLSGCFWCCRGGGVDIRVHASDISIVFQQPLPERTPVSCLPAFRHCPCSRELQIKSCTVTWGFALPLQVNSTWTTPVFPPDYFQCCRCCLCMASFCLDSCCRLWEPLKTEWARLARTYQCDLWRRVHGQKRNCLNQTMLGQIRYEMHIFLSELWYQIYICID